LSGVRPFVPLFRNPHVSTIVANFWPRQFDFSQLPQQDRLIQTDAETQVRVVTNRPATEPRGELVLLHGLEGGSDSGYMVSLAWTALQAGFITHRFHMRTCGGTAHLAKTLYHAGLTHDVRFFIESLHSKLPVFVAGFSLGGNVGLKLAGELGQTDLIHGIAAMSTPIDLAACTRRIHERDNTVYERRFVKRMRKRVLATGRYTADDIRGLDSIYLIDDKITAPSFGFGTADNYYATQSAANVLADIRVPALLLQAEDDTFIPFGIYSHKAFTANKHLRLLTPRHGGHLGFMARNGYRFWGDELFVDFFRSKTSR
jgi:predicted alpha/beta-fold hydrolase